jgi:hypothetical protein
MKIAFFLGRIHHAIKLLPVALGLQDAGHTIEFIITDNSINIDPSTEYLGKFNIDQFYHAKDFLIQHENLHLVDEIAERALSDSEWAMMNVAPFWVVSSCYDAAMDLMGFGVYLDINKPDAVFALHENNFFVKTLFYSAKERDIKTYTLMEGIILEREEEILKKYSTGTKYTDVLFSWSEYDKQYYADPDKIIPVGPSHFDDWIKLRNGDEFSETKVAIRNQYGLKTSGTVVMFAPPRLDLYRGDPVKAINEVAKWCNSNQYQLIIKLHPFQQGVQQITEMVKKYSNIIVSSNPDPMALLLASDLLITQTSTIALEALVLGIPVYELDLDYHGIEQPLHEQGAAILLHTLSDKLDMSDMSGDFINKRLPLADGKSVKRIVDYIGAGQWVK